MTVTDWLIYAIPAAGTVAGIALTVRICRRRQGKA